MFLAMAKIQLNPPRIQKGKECLFHSFLFLTVATVCPRSLVEFYTVSCYMKMDKTSWAQGKDAISKYPLALNDIIPKIFLHLIIQ